jgi:hypothetical protein
MPIFDCSRREGRDDVKAVVFAIYEAITRDFRFRSDNDDWPVLSSNPECEMAGPRGQRSRWKGWQKGWQTQSRCLPRLRGGEVAD